MGCINPLFLKLAERGKRPEREDGDKERQSEVSGYGVLQGAENRLHDGYDIIHFNRMLVTRGIAG